MVVALGASPAPAFVAPVRAGAQALRPLEHAPALYAFLAQAEPTDAQVAPAMLLLARALEQLGYPQASVAWLGRILSERADPQVLGEAVARLQTLFARPHDDALEGQLLGTLEVGSLPAGAARWVRLVQAVADLKAGRDGWAKASFQQLGEGSAEQAMAQHALLVTRVKRGESAQKLVAPFAALAALPGAPQPVRFEAQLAVARLKYESRDYAGALEAYRAVELPPYDPGRAALYLEEAWAAYRMGQTEAALSLLTTLQAPAFAQAFLPDAHLLRAQLYLDRCHHLPARRAARALLRQYDGALNAIRERQELAEVPSLKAAALERPAVKAAQAHLERTQREADRLAVEGSALGRPLGEHLAGLYGTALAEATRVRDARLERALEAVAERLLDAAEQVRLLEYEIGLKLNAALERNPGALVPASQDALGPQDVAYRFSGEFWNDELRDLHVTLDDRCQEASL